MFNTKDVTILFAAAGCGKTTYLIDAFCKELETYRPEDIAFVSFTRRGATEGRDRVLRETHVDVDRLEYFRTLHSLTFKELGLKPKQMFGYTDAVKFNKTLGFNISLNMDDEANTEDDKLLTLYDRIRSGKEAEVEVIDGFDSVRYDRITKAYEKYKQMFGKVDYTDCLIRFVERGKPVPVKVAFIDEAQDLTSLQWKVCQVAFAGAEKIFVAGDDFQSIYSYSGAKPGVLIDLAKRHKVVKLETSYRLPKKVYAIAKAATDILGEKVDKDYAPFKDYDGKVEFIGTQEVMLNKVLLSSKTSWLCLFRNNWFASMFTDRLESHLIPYQNSHGFFVSQDVLTRIRKYYNFRKSGFSDDSSRQIFMQKYDIRSFDDDFSESKIVTGPSKYVIQAYVDKYGIEELIRMSTEGTCVTVSTIHKAKGSEATNVAVFLDCTFKVYRTRFQDFDSELRLIYVALTRAKENLYIVSSESAFGLDDIIDTLRGCSNL